MTRRFRVLDGIHYHTAVGVDPTKRHKSGDDMIRMTKGDVIESDEDLVTKFVNKFEVIPEGPPPPPTSAARRQAVSQLLESGPWTEDDRAFLEGLSEDGFARVSKRISVPAGGVGQPALSTLPAGTPVPSTPVAGPGPSTDSKLATSHFGEDVTSLFQQAYDNNFKVFRNVAGRHQVLRSGGTKPLNKEPLGADGVDRFVAQQLK